VCYCGNDGDGTIAMKKQAAPLNCLKVFGKLRCGVTGNEVADCLAKKVIKSSVRYLHGIFVVLGYDMI
jgi:hypothetical protein